MRERCRPRLRFRKLCLPTPQFMGWPRSACYRTSQALQADFIANGHHGMTEWKAKHVNEMSNAVEAYLSQARRAVSLTFKRRWLAFGVAAAVALAGIVAILFVRDRYEAVARVYVDTQSVLKPLMEGLTYQPDIDQQVRMLARTLISQPNVEKLADMPGLHLDNGSQAERAQTVARLMDRIKINATSSGNLYEISYRGETPDAARRLVQATVDLFMHAGSGEKKRDSREAGRFIEDQIRLYEGKLVEAENRLKAFKLRNFGVSGFSNQDYFMRVSTLGDEVAKLRMELTAATHARDAYRRALASEDPQLPVDLLAKSGGVVPASGDARLEEARQHLEDLLRRYTEAHPDVVGARRGIAQLEAEANERKRALARGDRPAKAATSPVYQRLRVSLAEAEAQVASLGSQLALQQQRLDEVRSLAGRLPQVEAELAQLNRDYDIVRKTYDSMVARRESASLGVKLDESSQLAEFRLIEPPRVAPSPVPPSRWQLALLTLLASLVAGVGAALLAELVHPTFEEADALRAFSGRPVLGSVTLHATPASQAVRQAGLWRFGAAFIALLALQATCVAWLALQPRLH